MTTARPTQGGVWIPLALILLSLVPAVAGTVRLATLTVGAPSPENARFFSAPGPVVLHILAVVPFTILGAFQFSPRLRRYRWHRAAGRLLAPLGLLGALTGLWMAHFYPWPAGDGTALYVIRLVVGTAMAFSIVRSLFALGDHDYEAHGAWMTRGYALGMGAGTQVLTHLPWTLFLGMPGEASRAVLMALGWGINWGVAEYCIARMRPRRPVTRSRPAKSAA